MDPQRFDSLVLAISRAATRRRALAILLAGVVPSGLPGLAEAERHRGKDGKHGRGKDGKHGKDDRGKDGKHDKSRDKRHITLCRPESRAKTCKGKCGNVKNNCKKRVNCGACQACASDDECTAFPNSFCDLSSSTCACALDCAGKACGDDDGCGDSCLEGSCPTGQTCDAGACCTTTENKATSEAPCCQGLTECGDGTCRAGCCAGVRCDSCQRCKATTGECEADEGQAGKECGEPGQVCQRDGSCACAPDGSSCGPCQDCGANGACVSRCTAPDQRCCGGACKLNGGADCAAGGDAACCSGVCVAGVCKETCRAENDPCDGDSDCCQGASCANKVNGVGVCCASGKACGTTCCAAATQVCTPRDACCTPATCPAAQKCGPADDECGHKIQCGDCAGADQTCCDGVCKLKAGADCTENTDCCSRFCVDGTCQATCSFENDPCDGDSDCCSGTSCANKVNGVGVCCASGKACGTTCCADATQVCNASGACCPPRATCAGRCGVIPNNCDIDCGTCPGATPDCCDNFCGNLSTDVLHCGTTCGNARSCNDGTRGSPACCGGTCADLLVDPQHCGDCGTACPSTAPNCCPNPAPGVAAICTDTRSDLQNCGGCSKRCTTSVVPNATAVTCVGGNCRATACKSGFTVLAGACCDDDFVCGTGPNRTCCGTGETCCSGRCADLSVDPNNCGSCDNSCGGISCLGSECTVGSFGQTCSADAPCSFTNECSVESCLNANGEVVDDGTGRCCIPQGLSCTAPGGAFSFAGDCCFDPELSCPSVGMCPTHSCPSCPQGCTCSLLVDCEYACEGSAGASTIAFCDRSTPCTTPGEACFQNNPRHHTGVCVQRCSP